MEHLQHELSRRERQIMDVLFRLERASVADVKKNLPDPPSYSSVRAQLRILEEKGHISHTQEGPRYIYEPNMPLDRAKRSAVSHLAETFFEGSPAEMMVSLLDERASDLSERDLDRLAKMIERAREREE